MAPIGECNCAAQVEADSHRSHDSETKGIERASTRSVTQS
jgi:hypothetical protein